MLHLLANKRSLSTSWDVGLATAGVCAAIMLAACQDGAAQFLAWPSGGVGVAGAIAVRGRMIPVLLLLRWVLTGM